MSKIYDYLYGVMNYKINMRKKVAIGLVVVSLVSLAAISCEEIIPEAPLVSELLDGPADGLSPAEQAQFLAGDIAFNDEIFTTANGLGPLFVATSCGSCHAGDGKGHPFSTLTRFGQTDATGNQYLQQGGPQLQHRAIPGYTPEFIPSGATFTQLMPPANTGLGFLDAIADADLLSLADPTDVNGDGISGVPNWVNPPPYSSLRNGAVQQSGKYIGRFGKKGATYDLLQQTVNAYNQDIGITSSFEPIDTYSGEAIDPEVSNQTVQSVVFYLKTLKAPVPRNQNNQEVSAGKQLFINIGCGNCHTPELKTEPSPIAALSNKTIAPYTDLLLHDMGPALDDGYTEGSALTSEWRTPPLWGLGLSPNSQGGKFFLMHDGRAHSIQDAIKLHGGEAASSRDQYLLLDQSQVDELVQFLKSI